MEIIKTCDEIFKTQSSQFDFQSKCLEILRVLSEFPNGVTKTILESFLETKKPTKAWNFVASTVTIETKKVYVCVVKDIVDDIAEINNSIYTEINLSACKDAEWFSLIAPNSQLRFTDTCSALMARPRKKVARKDPSCLMIMPTKYVLFVLDHDRDQKFISTFRDLIENLQPGFDYKIAIMVCYKFDKG